LGKALAFLKADELIRSTLGAHVFDCFLEAKTIEWQEYCSHVTRWQTDRYLRIY
jgi:glutamine synthetase